MIDNMRSIQRFLSSTILIFIITANPALALAQTATPEATSSGANTTERMATLKTKADALITDRVTHLNALLVRINAMAKLSATDKTTFTTEINTDVSGLNTLKTKIDADTDLVTLRADVKSIFTTYRIYGIFMPQIGLLAAADRMSVTADTLSVLATKLQTRVQAAGSPADLTAIWTDMQAKITDAKTQYSNVETQVAALTPASYPATNVLQNARTEIKAGATDLRAALQDAKLIREGLKAIKTNSASGSADATK